MPLLLYLGLALYLLTAGAHLLLLRNGTVVRSPWSIRLLWSTVVCWLVIFAGFGLVDGWHVTSTQRWLWSSSLFLLVLPEVTKRWLDMENVTVTTTALAALLACLGYFSDTAQTQDFAHSGTLLKLHIGLAFIGLTAFAFGAATSLLYLFQERALRQNPSLTLKRRMPPLVKIDLLAFRSIVFGFPCYTAAILLGGVFAIRDASVGIAFTYWVALGSWLIYAFMLQARLVAGLRGQRAAKLTLLGLVGLLFVVGQYLVRGV